MRALPQSPSPFNDAAERSESRTPRFAARCIRPSPILLSFANRGRNYNKKGWRMTAHVRGSQTGEPIFQPTIYPAKYPLPAKNIETFADDVVVFTQSGAALDTLLARARIDLPGLAGADAVRRVISHNPDSLWAIARRQGFDAAAPVVDGFVAFLTLNSEGL